MKEETKKKRNTAVFILIATIVNLILMTVFMLVGYILLVRFADPEKPQAAQIWLIIIFIGSVILAWLIYSRMIKWYTKRVDVNEKFAPLITPRRRKPQTDDDMDGVKR